MEFGGAMQICLAASCRSFYQVLRYPFINAHELLIALLALAKHIVNSPITPVEICVDLVLVTHLSGVFGVGLRASSFA